MRGTTKGHSHQGLQQSTARDLQLMNTNWST